MPKRNELFNIADFALIRAAKNCELKLKDVHNGKAYLLVDDIDVTITKGDMGMPEIICRCKHCSNWGVNKNLMCRRKIRALWWLIRNNGRISEIYKEV